MNVIYLSSQLKYSYSKCRSFGYFSFLYHEQVISRFRFTFIFRNAERLLALSRSKTTSRTLKLILIVTLFGIRHCESFHRHFIVSPFSINMQNTANKMLRKREKQNFLIDDSRCAFAFFETRLKDRSMPTRKDSRKGETCF